jgi:ankyrin repeat protein
VLKLEESLLAVVNLNGETPLMTAVMNGHVSLASLLLERSQPGFREAIFQKDRYGFNVLHHAIRNGHKDLALALIEAQPELSKAVSQCKESPLFFAVMRGFADIYAKLMQNPDCAYSGGQHGRNCLHSAVRNGDKGEIYI